MLFNSLSFLFLFLPVTVLGFHLLGRLGRRPVVAWLTAASLLFYAAWNPAFTLFLIGSIVVNYTLARSMAAVPPGSPARSRYLVLGIGLNLVALFYFKYLYKTLLLVSSLHLAQLRPHPILLPLGISFFTFTQISYLVDLAQGQAERQDLLSYTLFVTFFPHLIAGPILHHKEMMPQFSTDTASQTPRRFRLVSADVTVGLTWFLLGLAKKVLIADRLAPQADFTFAHAGAQSAASAWTGLIVYSMQLYFDFSGYSDMALGLARIFSIRFPINFDSPYKALSVTEYWQRWHITLTRYITLYLYNPILLNVQRRRMLAGKKTSRKVLRTPAGFTAMIAYPTLVTMLLTGVWHGAGLQFLVFGAIHGVYLTVNQAWRHFRKPETAAHPDPTPSAPRRLALMVAVYLQVTFALIFFRATSLPSALALLTDLAGRHGLGHLDTLAGGALAFALFPVVWFFPNTQTILGQEPATERALAAQALTRSSNNPAIAPAQPNPATLPAGPIGASRTPLLNRLRWHPNLAWALVLAVLFFATLANLDTNVPFLYFQF